MANLERSQWSLELTDFLFFLGVERQTQIFNTRVVRIILLFSETGGYSFGLNEKAIKNNFKSLIFIFHYLDQN